MLRLRCNVLKECSLRCLRNRLRELEFRTRFKPRREEYYASWCFDTQNLKKFRGELAETEGQLQAGRWPLYSGFGSRSSLVAEAARTQDFLTKGISRQASADEEKSVGLGSSWISEVAVADGCGVVARRCVGIGAAVMVGPQQAATRRSHRAVPGSRMRRRRGRHRREPHRQ